jgi:uncharacterized membrane protein YidH (DUF202 family)
METLGRILLVFGAIFVISGLLLVILGRVPFMGRLPGDIRIEWRNVSCHFPLMTGIVLSILATVVLNLIMWLSKK